MVVLIFLKNIMTVKDLKEGIKNWRFTKEKIIFLSLGLSALLIYEFIASPIYRPYIYSHNIYDFHIADTIGNSIGTMATVFLFIGLVGYSKIQSIFLINTITISITIYELAHPALGKKIDPWDIAATILTGIFCLIFYHFVNATLSKKAKSSKKAK